LSAAIRDAVPGRPIAWPSLGCKAIWQEPAHDLGKRVSSEWWSGEWLDIACVLLSLTTRPLTTHSSLIVMTERDFAIDVVRRLREAGFQALWAGGCVRDQLLGLSPKDFDVATDARPDDVQRLFRRTVAVGVSFGVVEVLGPPPLKVQVATFRADVSCSDGRRPDAVVFTSAREDALRRDFTIN